MGFINNEKHVKRMLFRFVELLFSTLSRLGFWFCILWHQAFCLEQQINRMWQIDSEGEFLLSFRILFLELIEGSVGVIDRCCFFLPFLVVLSRLRLSLRFSRERERVMTRSILHELLHQPLNNVYVYWSKFKSSSPAFKVFALPSTQHASHHQFGWWRKREINSFWWDQTQTTFFLRSNIVKTFSFHPSSSAEHFRIHLNSAFGLRRLFSGRSWQKEMSGKCEKGKFCAKTITPLVQQWRGEKLL